ncbi:MAG: tRNA (5-methylaminomethyl-2-thiouridylate)-methyltransferase [Candidatus Cloacimonadaceae bacterium]|nr:tRNA (5-methylaminomethyl-2-thiouridylate)-methyltransferase [Candidatus Cloacimonadaceae bacterium]
MKQHKAIALFSGGLDSILSVKWMQKHGYTVFPVFFRAPYIPSERAIDIAGKNSIELIVRDITAAHLEMMKNPKYGFGGHLNPCIDCHALMFRMAGNMLAELGADFLISGEVLGQRPMSQRRDALDSVANHSGFPDLLIRPLSQKLLPDTLPIREGWVDKTELLAFHGRGRKDQICLAAEMEIVYPTPAGGCLLTDRNFTLRLKDLIAHGQTDEESITLLRFGRHFRLSAKTKLIIGRTEADNNELEKHSSSGIRMLIKEVYGPLGIIISEEPERKLLSLAASILLYYSRKAPSPGIVKYGIDNNLDNEIVVSKCPEDILRKHIISLD